MTNRTTTSHPILRTVLAMLVSWLLCSPVLGWELNSIDFWSKPSKPAIQQPVKTEHADHVNPGKSGLARQLPEQKHANTDSRDSGKSVSIWSEPVRGSDGRFTSYVPPKKVLDFLEAPSMETARNYLRWQVDRTRQLQLATRFLQMAAKEGVIPEYRQNIGSIPRSEVIQAPNSDGYIYKVSPKSQVNPLNSLELVVFYRSECIYCTKFLPILDAFKKRHPSVPVRMVGPEERDLWSRFQVSGTPTIIFLNNDTLGAARIDGFVDYRTLRTAWDEFRQRENR